MSETNIRSPELAVWSGENPGLQIPFEVLAFATKHGIKSYLAIAASLVEKHFTLKTPINLSKVEDSDSKTEWVEVLATVSGDVAAVQEAHSDYTDEWLRAVPLDKSPLIRLALNLD